MQGWRVRKHLPRLGGASYHSIHTLLLDLFGNFKLGHYQIKQIHFDFTEAVRATSRFVDFIINAYYAPGD